MKEDMFDTNPLISTLICSIIGLSLVGNLSAQEQNTLGNWLMLIAQVIITNSSSQNTIQERAKPPIININSRDFKNMYNPFIYDINTLINMLNKMYPDSCNESINLLYKSINIINSEIEKIKKGC